MSDRTLVDYKEDRLPDGPHWGLEIQRSANGQPGLLFTITYDSFDGTLPHREMTIVVKDGNALLAPVIEWLKRGVLPLDPEPWSLTLMSGANYRSESQWASDYDFAPRPGYEQNKEKYS